MPDGRPPTPDGCILILAWIGIFACSLAVGAALVWAILRLTG